MSFYADDIAILWSANSWDEVKLNLTEWLVNLDVWLRENQLSLNINESTYITFGTDSQSENFELITANIYEYIFIQEWNLIFISKNLQKKN